MWRECKAAIVATIVALIWIAACVLIVLYRRGT